MELAKVASNSIISSRFNKMLLLPPPWKKTLFLPIKPFNFNFRVPFCGSIQCNSSNDQIATHRRPAVFEPTIWNDDYIQSLSSEYKEETYREQSKVVREEVRMMICKVENELDQLELIDVLQRIGVAYHFKNEIKNILDNIYSQIKSTMEKSTLHATSLKFRLLRQHGYDISTDIFVNFKDEMGNFKNGQPIDINEMLSLYEASFHSFEDEFILDETRDFTTKILKEYLSENEGNNNYLSLLIDHALELPIHWRIPRWEVHWFIHAYERSQNMNRPILRLAKLDFNLVQTTYQEELKYASRWWERIGLAKKLSFARDRVVENYMWSIGINFDLDNEYFRNIISKVICLITIIDDIYDMYGTIEELKLFTEAIDRWDPRTIDNLPRYMKICYFALNDFVDEVAFQNLQKNGHNITPYLKKVWTDLCKTYLIEAKWFHSGYTPSFEEYMENAWVSVGAPLMLTFSYFLVPHSFKEEDLVHLEEYSDMIRYSSTIFRLANDLGTSSRENEMGDNSKSIQCYMNEKGVCEDDAREHIKSMLRLTWKKMNKEGFSSCLPEGFKDVAINASRTALYMYQHGDGHSVQFPHIKNCISSLVFKPISDI